MQYIYIYMYIYIYTTHIVFILYIYIYTYNTCILYTVYISSLVHWFTRWGSPHRPSLGEDDLQGLWRSFDKDAVPFAKRVVIKWLLKVI